MERIFATHEIRETEELSGKLWNLELADKDYRGQAYVPGCFENNPMIGDYKGVGVYTTTVKGGGNLRFSFKGVSHTADVFLDDIKIAHHYNAFTSFDAVCRDVNFGNHELKVVVDNRFSEASALHVENDYFTYGGITRPVVMESLKDVYIDFAHFQCEKDHEGYGFKITVGLNKLTAPDFAGNLHMVLLDRESTAVAIASQPVRITGDSEVAVFSFDNLRGINEWSHENPYLYTLKIIITDEQGDDYDDLIDRVGFRTVEIKDGFIYMNGRKLKIKGFCRHEEHPMFGCAIPPEAMMEDLMLMKDMGANAVRTSHYPNDERFLDLCDELGFLVWEENHARGLEEDKMRNPNFEPQCEDCIREMIKAHFNHPSIYIWGILNECASETEYGYECYKKQFELIKELDSTRPRSFASCRFFNDICLGLEDVVSYNIYPLWYHDTDPSEYLESLYNWVQKDTEGAGKPFLITEVGAGAIYGYRTPQHVKWSEEYQADALKRQLTGILNHPKCSGVYIWQFCDGRVCDSWFAIRPGTKNNKGVVDAYRRPKLSYETVKQIFTEEWR